MFYLRSMDFEVGCSSSLILLCVLLRFVCGGKGQVTLEKEWSQVPKQYALQEVAKVTYM